MLPSSPHSKPINLLRGHPNPSLLPTEEMQSLMATLSDPNSASNINQYLNYGNEQGNQEFLDELQAFVSRNVVDDDLGYLEEKDDEDQGKDYEEKCGDTTKIATEYFITHGVSHGIELLCATHTKPGDVVLLENPTYFLVHDIFCSHDLDVQSLPMTTSSNSDGDGSSARTVDVPRLIALVEQGLINVPRLIYIIPSYQNPTGSTIGIQDRLDLASFAYRHGIIIVADEVYHLLDWRNVSVDGKRPARMAALNHMCHVPTTQMSEQGYNDDKHKQVGGCCTVSSFTKIWSPGVRVGWIEGPSEIIKSLKSHGYIQSQGGCAPFMGEIMRHALSTRMADNVLQTLRRAYRDRAKLVCDIFEESSSNIQVLSKPLGGYFIWIRFPKGVRSEEFLKFCQGQVTFLPGERCDPFPPSKQQRQNTHDVNDNNTIQDAINEDHGIQNCARLCFADSDVDMLEEGTKRLVQCLQQYTEEKFLK
mmetsp:Transcript_11266/g.17426  ORF Transcript_11266/g.17426 Transcript_11266/m.17426 type:complete len:476 (-) Transcript_11266:72-1499(-)|eukprot:CAMPEP_0195304066 /NCGR_PEP_ID=MMETSP0707-20130614/33801_1 /TAXON_ID=33640 /ORGANISM="Asterionellopsis glacialis, Strain CCMP134" /LENGTH=475 /DNA_ID=CAMNT_0040367775 /DNA_START=113 /DNA_END=1540 /DNA_ORIENTATION=-